MTSITLCNFRQANLLKEGSKLFFVLILPEGRSYVPMQTAYFTADLRPNTHQTLPQLDIQLQQRTASESQVSSECHLDNFDVVPTGKRHLAQCQFVPCDGTKFSTLPCDGKTFAVSYRILLWRTDTAHWTYHPPGSTATSRMLTPNLLKLESIAVTSKHFKHSGLDDTLVVHTTERKHDDRYHFYCYFTIPTLVAILLTIMLCNGYPYLFRNILHNIGCTTQPVANTTPANKSQSPPELPPKQQPSTSQLQSDGSGRTSEFVTYSVQTEAWSRDFQSTGQSR